MVNENELQQVIYNVLLMQIRFGTYHYGEHLPTLEEASQLFLVSIDTVRAAYLSLKRGGCGKGIIYTPGDGTAYTGLLRP